MHRRASRGSESSGVSQGRARPERAHPGQAEEETTRLTMRDMSHHSEHQVTDMHSNSCSRNQSILTPFPVKQ